MLKQKIQMKIEELRPALQMDGGDLEFVSFDEKTGVVKVRLQGHCAHCPMSQITLKEGVAAALKKEFKEITEVVSIR